MAVTKPQSSAELLVHLEDVVEELLARCSLEAPRSTATDLQSEITILTTGKVAQCATND